MADGYRAYSSIRLARLERPLKSAFGFATGADRTSPPYRVRVPGPVSGYGPLAACSIH